MTGLNREDNPTSKISAVRGQKLGQGRIVFYLTQKLSNDVWEALGSHFCIKFQYSIQQWVDQKFVDQSYSTFSPSHEF